MDHRFKSVIGAIALACSAQMAHAGYALLKPPVTWSPSPAPGMGSPGLFNASGAANSAKFEGSVIRTSATLSVSGRAVAVPVALQVERAAAARMLAGRIAAGLLGGPAGLIFAGLTVYQFLQNPAVAEWWSNTGYFWDSSKQEWRYRENTSCYVTDSANPCAASAEEACRYQAAKMGSGFVRVYTSDGNLMCQLSNGFLISISQRPGQTVDRKADYLTEVKPTIEQKPIPEKLPEVIQPLVPQTSPVIQPFQWPVNDPLINPDPALNPKPMFVPTGDPVRNPNYNPNAEPSPQNQPWIRPGVQIVPSPTPGEPWRVDVQPVDVPQPTNNPNDTPDPNKDPDTKPEPKQDAALCEQYPDILACQKIKPGELEPVEIPNREVPLSIQPDTGWGTASASCPAPKTGTVMGVALEMPYDLLCNFATAIKPLLIGFAWLSAALTFFGIGRRE